MNELTVQTNAGVLEKVMLEGDLATLQPAERIQYYAKVCESLGLNPLTKPFDYIRLNGKLTLYVKRDATEQLRKIHKVSINIVSREKIDDIYVVTARATDAQGRTDESVGAVNLKGLSGEALANAIMKAETKAKRRVTLSIVGLGWLDESEVSSIPDAQVIDVTDAGEIIEPEKPDFTIVENAAAYVVTFGKHKGKTLGEIVKKDPGWVNWYRENGDNDDIKTALATLVNAIVEARMKKQQEKAHENTEGQKPEKTEEPEISPEVPEALK